MVEDSTKVNDHVVVVRKLSIGDADELKRLGDRIISNIGSGIGILFDDGGEKPAAVVVVSADLVKKELNAGKLAKEIGSLWVAAVVENLIWPLLVVKILMQLIMR